MTRLLLSTLLSIAVTGSAADLVIPVERQVIIPAERQVIMPAERRIYVNSLGDVLEWQPGFGILVVKPRRTVTRVTTRSSDGKSIIRLERATRVESPTGVSPTMPLDPRRANDRSNDDAQSLMEEVEKPEIIPR